MRLEELMTIRDEIKTGLKAIRILMVDCQLVNHQEDVAMITMRAMRDSEMFDIHINILKRPRSYGGGDR